MHIIQDGRLLDAQDLLVHPDSPGLCYGDGLFETMLVLDGTIRLWDFHAERLRIGMRSLGYAVEADLDRKLRSQVLALCEAEHCITACRVRINVFRSEGALFDPAPSRFHYIIRATAATSAMLDFQPAGISLGIYRGAVRCCDGLSAIKTQNYLPSVMAARYAAAEGWGDALLLNQAGRVAESAVANVFILTEGVLVTPPLSEGCVAGVMRRQLLTVVPGAGFRVMERPLTPGDIEQAEEIFLTNAIRGVRPVTRFQEREYPARVARRIFDAVTP